MTINKLDTYKTQNALVTKCNKSNANTSNGSSFISRETKLGSYNNSVIVLEQTQENLTKTIIYDIKEVDDFDKKDEEQVKTEQVSKIKLGEEDVIIEMESDELINCSSCYRLSSCSIF